MAKARAKRDEIDKELGKLEEADTTSVARLTRQFSDQEIAGMQRTRDLEGPDEAPTLSRDIVEAAAAAARALEGDSPVEADDLAQAAYSRALGDTEGDGVNDVEAMWADFREAYPDFSDEELKQLMTPDELRVIQENDEMFDELAACDTAAQNGVEIEGDAQPE